MDKSVLIETILFWRGEPMAIAKLATILKITEVEINSELEKLREILKTRGVRLMEKDGEVVLATAPEANDTIADLTREEFNRELGKAGLETLSIILYRGPISRSEIDYIRGVNSTFILRNLLIRGLVEKISDEKDQRRFLYRPTFEMLGHIGVTKVTDLPEYTLVQEEIRQFKEAVEKEKQAEKEVAPSED